MKITRSESEGIGKSEWNKRWENLFRRREILVTL